MDELLNTIEALDGEERLFTKFGNDYIPFVLNTSDLKRLALALRTRMEDDTEPETCLVEPVETRVGWGR